MAEWTTALVPMLGRALLHFLWQGALIGLVAALALQVLRNARPQARYLVACLALLACVAAPMATVALQWGDSEANPAMRILAATANIAPATTPALPLSLQSVDWLDDAMPWIVALWASGAFALSLRMAFGVAWVQQLRGATQTGDHALWQARLDDLSARFGIARRVALRLVDSLDSPVAAGWWRPVVLLPTAVAARMPVDLVEALLAHELAHVRRHDYLVNLLQSAVEALLFYHPVTWWLSRRIRIEREHIADAMAVAITGQPRKLALALSQLSDLQRPDSVLPHLAPAAHGGHLMSRIEQLVRPARRTASGRIAFPLLGLAAACIAFYAHAQIDRPAPAAEAASAPNSTRFEHLQLHSNSQREAYAIVRKGNDGITMSGSSDDLSEIKRAQARVGGDFLWFRRDGRSYVITDPATLSRIDTLWKDSRQIGDQMETLGDQMEVHGDKMEALGARMEQLSADAGPTPAMEQATQRMETLARHQSQVAGKQAKLAAAMARADDAERDSLDTQMDALSNEMEALGRQMEQQGAIMEKESRGMDQRQAPMDALSREMDAASKPMDALGKQMDALGQRQERAVAQAEREMRPLIDQAIRTGLAQPSPGQRTQQ